MLLGLIFSILTASYTLSSNNTVLLEGEAPVYSTYDFERSSTTGRKGQMTKGNSTRLHLGGWDGSYIHRITLEMHSNSGSGKGSMTMQVGDEVVWQIENKAFSSKEWAGMYSTAWVDISKDIEMEVGDDGEIDILISATENSLYINRYVIEYEPASPRCYSVSFSTGLDTVPDAIEQTEIGVPVILPAWQDTAMWYFLGWSEMEVEDSTVAPDLLLAGSEYVPRRNTKLWAVYSDVKEMVAIDDYASGRYVMAMWNQMTEYYAKSGMAMAGKVEANEVALCAADMTRNKDGRPCMLSSIEDDMIYELYFAEDSTLYILHEISGTMIGHKYDKLYDTTESIWKYRVLDDGSLVVYSPLEEATNTFALSFGTSWHGDELLPVAQTLRMDVTQYKENAMWLFPILYPRYVCWPFGKPEIEDVDKDDIEDGEAVYLMNIGRYALYVKGGKKYLMID